ncbi:hypothetical protein [Actinacidiphila glaucinigra]|uniref:hypothetical protein n=1 Tax=Actinacidiphila glaucinigra TaxID=235986 RepID=UPI0035DB39E3
MTREERIALLGEAAVADAEAQAERGIAAVESLPPELIEALRLILTNPANPRATSVAQQGPAAAEQPAA